MDTYEHESEHRKKRRRREIAPRPTSARLTFDDSLKNDIAVVSPALWSILVAGDGDSTHDSLGAPTFIAVSPATPSQEDIEASVWTLVEARRQDAGSDVGEEARDQARWIKLSPKSLPCAPILKAYAAQDHSHSRHGAHIPKTIDISVVQASPLALETVYVTVEKGLLDKSDEIQSKFGGGFQHHAKNLKSDPKSIAINSSQKPEERLRALVREALAQLSLVHAGDIFHLPLPLHPITHARPPPAIAIECEPVSQGRIVSATKIVLIQAGSSQEKAVQKLAPTQPIIEESLEDTAEDTANDQFYSAAEDKQTSTASDADGDSDAEPTSDESESNSDDDSDSMEDIISLSAPGLPPQQAGTLSAMTSATPRPGDRRATGTHTPGSVYSSFSASTARAGSRPGKVLRTEPLLRRIPSESLHPKPQSEDDEDSFVFVDTSILAKIGCFSGDWVRIEVSKNVSLNGFPTAGLAALRGFPGEEESDWRAVKIFGLSGLLDQKARYAVDKTGDRRTSFSHRDSFTSLTPKIYLSPVLLANLANPQFVKVGGLPKALRHELKQRPSTSKSPPFAKEVSLLKLSTPITTRRDLQPAIFSLLKRYFETRKRVLKRGDLIAIPIDEELGKVVSSASGGEADPLADDLVDKLQGVRQGIRHTSTAWFYVQRLDAEPTDQFEDAGPENPWGGVAVVDHLSVRLHTQAGTREQTISDATELWTRYWLGIQAMPQQNIYRSDVVTTPNAIPRLQKQFLEKKLSSLIAASVSPRAISLSMPPIAILLHSNQRQIGKTYTAQSACSSVGVHTFTVSAHDLLSENASTTGGGDVKTEGTLKGRAETALSCGNQQTALLIQNIDVLTAPRMQSTLHEIIKSSRVLIATSSKIDDIPSGVRSLFTHEFEISAPNENARELILRNATLSCGLPLNPTVNLKSIALQTAALVAGDLVDVVNRAVLARSQRLAALAQAQHVRLSDITIAGGHATTHLLPGDFTSAISAARATFSDAIGAPKIPTVTWDDVGGLASQKDAIMETISLPLTHPELFASGIRKRSGILFYGPPGTGKTLLAKAIATEFSLNFFSVKGPELLNMYIGESEANVRRVFQRARDARPCVVFFDELDSVAPKRGNQGDSGGVMDRIVSQLLAELDGMSSSTSSNDDEDNATSSTAAGSGVFVIGATNRPDLLDPALLRPGRFDKMLYLGVADTHDSQVTILRALTRKFTLDPTVDLVRVASRLPFTYTGADLYALASDAMLKAITRKTEAVDVKVRELSKQRGEDVSTGYFFDHLATAEDTDVVVNEEDFVAAQRDLVGSVSKRELEHFERIRSVFEEQDISSSTATAKAKGKEQSKLSLRPGAGVLQTNAYPGSNPINANPNPNADADELVFSTPPQNTAGRHPSHPAPTIRSPTEAHDANTATGKGKGKGRPPAAPQRSNTSIRSPTATSAPASARVANPLSAASSDSDDPLQRLSGSPVDNSPIDTDGATFGVDSDEDEDVNGDGDRDGDADISAAGESDFGVSRRGFGGGGGLNGGGRVVNGDSTSAAGGGADATAGTASGTHHIKNKGKGKGKMPAPGEFVDVDQDGDEELYD